jgi:hypothetical protein
MATTTVSAEIFTSFKRGRYGKGIIVVGRGGL